MRMIDSKQWKKVRTCDQQLSVELNEEVDDFTEELENNRLVLSKRVSSFFLKYNEKERAFVQLQVDDVPMKFKLMSKLSVQS